MKEFELEGFNNYSISITVWDEVENPKAIVQIVHGMVEHIRRYDDFAKFLNRNGYIVIGDDHRGHGKTAKGQLGIVPDGDCFNDTVQDEIIITRYAKEKYNLPLVLFGHSYGSFLSQSYIELNSEEIIGCTLCGSACQNTFEAKLGKIVANLQLKTKGKDAKAELIKSLSFGAYEKQFKKEKKRNAWLSKNEENREAYAADPLCDYTMSVGFYASFFNGLSKIYKSDNIVNISKNLPIYIISGDKDPVGKNGKLVNKLFELYNDVAIKNVSMKLYRDCRHEILNEDIKHTVYNDFLNFADNCLEQCDIGRDK